MRNLATLSFLLLLVFMGRRFFVEKAGNYTPVKKKVAISGAKIETILKEKVREAINVKPITNVIKVNPKTNKKINKSLRIIFKDGFAPVDSEGNLIIQSVSLDGDKAIIYGDVIVGSKDDIMDINRKGKPVILLKPHLWEQATIHYEIDSSLPNYDAVEESIKYFNELNIVKFVQGHADNYIYFRAGDNNCYSYVGMIGGEQEISLSPSCGFKEINHELMHALGFLHEQSREDRDEFLTIKWDNIKDDYKKQFEKISNSFLNVGSSPFDFKSILLYPPTAFARETGLKSMSKKDGSDYKVVTDGLLSEQDRQRLKQLYKK